jgi:ABC-type transport system substrate-binding protein
VKIGEAFFHNKAPVNGRKVTAQDVKASYETAAKQTKISNSSWWTQILQKVDAPDATTVNFTLKAGRVDVQFHQCGQSGRVHYP